MYALTGASGQLGRLVLKHLLTFVPAEQIIATTRNPEKLDDFASAGVVIRRADFNDPASLSAAFEGAKRLLIISTDIIGTRVEQHKAAIAGAVVAGVEHIVYTSGPGANPNASHPILVEHGHSEEALAASGLGWTALRNSFYTEGLKGSLEILLFDRQLLIPEGTARHSWVTREDCARAAAGALAGRINDSGPLDVTGPEALGFADLAQRLSTLSGKTVTAQVLPEKEILARVLAKGIPETAAGFVVGFAGWTAREVSTSPADTVERASGSKPVSVDAELSTLAI